MASLAISSSATPSLAASADKTRVAQARRDAEQAQNTADNLRRQADAAERTAQVSQENARSLAERSNQLVANYVQSQRVAPNEPRTLGTGVVAAGGATTAGGGEGRSLPLQAPSSNARHRGDRRRRRGSRFMQAGRGGRRRSIPA